jgi:hypothetical protein
MMSVEQSVEWKLAGESEILEIPQIPHDLTWKRTLAALLTAWAMVHLSILLM